MLTKEEAKAAVRDIAAVNGYIDDLTADMDPVKRAELKKRFRNVEGLAAGSIKTVAKQIYGNGARFIFELLQNAEDNTFEKAKKKNQAPFVAFQVHPDRIVVECNEDGFSKEDLTAICAIGKSTKLSTHGYIGAKGIGFKSVFIAAWKVHIQSGPFSFKFEHKRSDAGLGMIRPLWVESDEILNGPLTRMTLTLHDDGAQADMKHLRKIIDDQFRELEQTCLLFLRKITSIHIKFYNDEGGIKKSTVFQKDTAGINRVLLKATVNDQQGNEEVKLQHYHVTKYNATGLARSDNRDDEIPADIASTAEVVLAFQLTESSEPVDNKQQTFAFLPMPESNFRFLIHSDFDTNVNREMVVSTSRRNLDLLDPIAETFIKAVLQFCDHPTLCYTWPQFLPLAEECSTDFWTSLYQKIKSKIASSNILRSRNRSDLRKISEVYYADPSDQDSEGVLYLDDPVDDPFLSSKYERTARKRLEQYGLLASDWNLTLKLLRRDLAAPESKMLNPSTDAKWHSGVARLLSQCFENNLNRTATKIRGMSLIPLRDGTWLAANNGQPFYMPTSQGVDIPATLDLKIIDPQAIANDDRRTFFKHLGASYASVDTVRSSIDRAYGRRPSEIDSTRAKSYLGFLFLTQNEGESSFSIAQLPQLWLASDKNYITKPSSCYLPGDSPSGLKALLEPQNDAPGFPIPFVHSDYLKHSASSGISRTAWEAWLCDALGVKRRLALAAADGSALSDAVKYVAQYRPERFLGLLQALWIHEGRTVTQRPHLLKAIQGLPAAKFCGSEFSFAPSLTLKNTCVPSPELRERAQQYMEDPDRFPFLSLEDNQYKQPLNPKWSFLYKDLKIHHADDPYFLSLLWMRIQAVYAAPSSVRTVHKICELYVGIEAKIRTVILVAGWRKHFRSIVNQGSFILVPSRTDGSATWSVPSKCLWEGPANMISKNSLRALYSRILGEDEMDMLDGFFHRTLEIPNASKADILDELRAQKQHSQVRSGSVKELYEYLDRISQDPKTYHQLSLDFEREALVYVSGARSPGWYRTSHCLWTSKTEISGKAILDGEYEDLRELFVQKLGVRSLSIQMVYDELLSCSSASDFQDVRSNIFAFNSLLQTKHQPLDHEKIQEACVFPIRYPNGTIRLGTAKLDFAIGDRDYLLPSFKDRIKILSYTMEEVRRLTPFFKWARLQKRYLSTLVKADTSVAERGQSPISSRIRNLRFKAHYILRIAATFDSPRFAVDARGLYDRLLSMEIIEAQKIMAVLKVSQDNKLVKVQEKAGDEHIDDTKTPLRIYVPANKTAQDVTYGTSLPIKLAEWLMRHDTTQIFDSVPKDAVNALTLVLTMERSALDHIFEHQGIIDVEIPDEDEKSSDEEPSIGEEVERNQPDDEQRNHQNALSNENIAASTSQDSRAADMSDSISVSETLVEEVSARANFVNRTNQPRPGTSRTRETSTLGSTVAAIAGNSHPISPSHQVVQSMTSIRVESGDAVTLTTTTYEDRHTTHSVPDEIPSQRYSALQTQPSPMSRAASYEGRQTILPGPDETPSQPYFARQNQTSPTSRAQLAPHVSTSTEAAQYLRILNKVVAVAREPADHLPALGAFDMRSMRDALSAGNDDYESYDGLDVLSRFRSSNQLERDKKIGAAGELFVFEVFMNQHLPNWSRENWQSTIRHYVSAHEDYSDLQPWRHRETADIVYHDTEGRLTEMLVTKEYLNDEWLHKTPKYFIEVKTTTGPCNTPFYMSGNQYQLMQRIHSADGHDELYIIMRVFSVNSERPKLCVFVDPEGLRQNGQLVFTGQTWSIVPGASMSD